MKSDFLLAAAMGLTTGLAQAPAFAQDTQETEKCYGINKCKAHSSCAVTKADIMATKEAFGAKFAESAIHECAGSGKCAAKAGQLGYLKVAKGACENIEGGFKIVAQNGKTSVVK